MPDIPTITQTGQIPGTWQTRHQLARAGLRPVDRMRPDCWIPWTASPEDDRPCGLWSPGRTEALPPRPDAAQRDRDRELAQQHATKSLADPDRVVLDTETTSLRNGHVIEIAVVDADGTRLVDTLVYPAEDIDPATTAVHGLSARDVAEAPTPPQLASLLDEVLSNRVIIAWNADFDQDALRRSFEHWHMPIPDWLSSVWLDAMQWYAAYLGEWDPVDGRYRNHPLDGGHRAAADCQATWDRVGEIVLPSADPATLAMLHERIRRELDLGVYNDLSGIDVAEHLLAITAPHPAEGGQS